MPLGQTQREPGWQEGEEQVNDALVGDRDGCPVSNQIFPGNSGDPLALTALAQSIHNRFGIDGVALVGNRGMITSIRIRDDLPPRDWTGS